MVRAALEDFDFEELRKRLIKVMRKKSQTQAQWARDIDTTEAQLSNFLNGKKKRMLLKNAVKMEQFVEKMEKEFGI